MADGDRHPHGAAERSGLIAVGVVLTALAWVFLLPAPPNAEKHEPVSETKAGYYAGGYRCRPEQLAREGSGERYRMRSAKCAEAAEDQRLQQANLLQQTRAAQAAKDSSLYAYEGARATLLQSILLGWTLGAALWAGWAATRAARAADRTLEHAQWSAERELRAYVFVTAAQIQNPISGGLITVKIENSGETPAYGLKIYGGFALIPFINTEMLTLDFSQVVSVQDVGPNGITFKNDVSPALDATQAAQLTSGNLALFVHGEIRYRDAFDHDRVTRYRLFTGGPAGIQGAQMQTHHNGNDAT